MVGAPFFYLVLQLTEGDAFPTCCTLSVLCVCVQAVSCFWKPLLFHSPVSSFLFRPERQPLPRGSHPCLPALPTRSRDRCPFHVLPSLLAFLPPWMTGCLEDRDCVGKDRDRSAALRTSPGADAEMFNKS